MSSHVTHFTHRSLIIPITHTHTHRHTHTAYALLNHHMCAVDIFGPSANTMFHLTDSASLPTPIDENYGDLPIPMDQYQKSNRAIDDLEHDYMNDPMFSDDIFMQQPQEAI